MTPRQRALRLGGPAADGLVCALAALLLFVPSLFNGFTNWDDGAYVVANPFAAQGAAGVWAALTTPFDFAWYPVTQVLQVLVSLAAGPGPLAQHLTSVVLFAVAAGLAPQALRNFGVPRPVALVAVLLWLAHPFRVESVAWAANLKDVTSLAFLVAAFAAFPRSRAGSFVLWVLALGSKSMVAPVAVLFLFLAWPSDRWRAWRTTLPFTLAALVTSVVAGVLRAGADETFLVPPAPLQGIVWRPWWYLGRIVWPSAPRAIYDFVEPGLGDVRTLAAVGGFGLLAAGVAWKRTRRWTLLGAAVFLLPLASVCGVVALGQPVAERYTLIPSLAVAATLAALLFALPGRRAPLVVVPLIVVLAWGSATRQREWKDGVTLWQANAPLAPRAFAVAYNLGGALAAQGRYGEAWAWLVRAKQLRPAWPTIDCDVASARAAAQGVDRQWVAQVLRGEICPADANGRLAALRELTRSQRLLEARVLVEELELGSLRGVALQAVAQSALELRANETALSLSTAAVVAAPELSVAWVTRAEALFRLGRTAELLAQPPPADPAAAAQVEQLQAMARTSLGP